VPRKLERYGATNWVLSQIDFQDGPYLPVNGSQATVSSVGRVGRRDHDLVGNLDRHHRGANNGSGAIRITSANHGWKTGDRIDISAVGGTVEANNAAASPWTVIRVSASTFDLAGSTFANAYTAGGTDQAAYLRPHRHQRCRAADPHPAFLDLGLCEDHRRCLGGLGTADVLSHSAARPRYHLAARPLQPGRRLSLLRHLL
jgi:hypothetical protein